jgi:UPF0271 protein
MRVDLNSDLGEGFGPYAIADDEGLMGVITSANVACGYHAGDPVVMDRTICLARDHGVDLGAHISYPDRMGFGRRNMQMDLGELEKHILYQLGALHGLARARGHRVTHMNPHGALGNLASADRAVAEAVVSATSAFDPEITYIVLHGSAMDAVARERGHRTFACFLADRAYTANGQLAPRSLPGAVIKDTSAVVGRVRRALAEGVIEALDGSRIPVALRTILVHSDTPASLELAGSIRQAILDAGHEVAPLSAD